jgi:hypothetical protein
VGRSSGRNNAALRWPSAKRMPGWAYGACATMTNAGAASAAAATLINAARAPQGWTWLHHVLKGLREGRSQPEAVEAANLATLGYRRRVTVRWKVKGWDPIEFVQLHDGSWEHADVADARPPLDPRFVKLAASAWLLTPSRRHRVRQ